MIRSRMIGDVRVSSILEYSGPTHAPDFLFPGIEQADLEAHRDMLAPHHWVPEMNKLVVTIQSWFVETPNARILIDAGVGNSKPRPAPRMNMLNTLFLEWLEAAGGAREEITHVVITHIHVDHVGWCTVRDGECWTPTFPNARYYFPRQEYEAATARAAAGNPSPPYLDSIKPVFDAGLGETTENGAIADVLTIVPAPGHTPGQFMLSLESNGERGLFVSDVLHSPLQIARPDINSRYCEDAERARRTRLEVLNAAADSGALVMPFHFGAPYCGFVRRVGDGFTFEPADVIA